MVHFHADHVCWFPLEDVPSKNRLITMDKEIARSDSLELQALGEPLQVFEEGSRVMPDTIRVLLDDHQRRKLYKTSH